MGKRRKRAPGRPPSPKRLRPQEPNRTSFAERFELLLQMFPFPDREHLSSAEERRWRNSELSEATGFRLSASYLSSLRRGKIEDPGLTKLDLLARVMGFPTELWVLEPGEWAERLENNARTGLRPETLADEHFPTRLRRAFRTPVVDTVSGELINNPYEVARRSGGRLTEQALDALLEGRRPPTLTELLALSEALEPDLYEWGGAGWRSLEGSRAHPPEPPSLKEQLLSRESRGLDEHELEFTLQFIRQLKELRAKHEGRSTSYSPEPDEDEWLDDEDDEDLPGD